MRRWETGGRQDLRQKSNATNPISLCHRQALSPPSRSPHCLTDSLPFIASDSERSRKDSSSRRVPPPLPPRAALDSAARSALPRGSPTLSSLISRTHDDQTD